MNAVSSKFQDCTIHGCFFHPCQNVYKHVQSNGLQEQYTANAEFALEVRQLAALAFVPIGDVVSYFKHLKDNLSDLADPLLEYFEHYYIGTWRHNGQRREPMFLRATWNVYQRTAVGEDCTNNCQEGWHRNFSATIACHHPTVWKLLDGLLTEQAAMEARLEKYIAGDQGPAKEKRYQDRDRRLQTLVNSFEARPLVST